jgi:hypothetical protein
VRVAILSAPTFDATVVDPALLTFSGARVAHSESGRFLVKKTDVNHDGLSDIIVSFDLQGFLLGPSDTQGVVQGLTRDGRLFVGTGTLVVKLQGEPSEPDAEDEQDNR